jgi:hypothetical protein
MISGLTKRLHVPALVGDFAEWMQTTDVSLLNALELFSEKDGGYALSRWFRDDRSDSLCCLFYCFGHDCTGGLYCIWNSKNAKPADWDLIRSPVVILDGESGNNNRMIASCFTDFLILSSFGRQLYWAGDSDSEDDHDEDYEEGGEFAQQLKEEKIAAFRAVEKYMEEHGVLKQPDVYYARIREAVEDFESRHQSISEFIRGIEVGTVNMQELVAQMLDENRIFMVPDFTHSSSTTSVCPTSVPFAIIASTRDVMTFCAIECMGVVITAEKCDLERLQGCRTALIPALNSIAVSEDEEVTIRTFRVTVVARPWTAEDCNAGWHFTGNSCEIVLCIPAACTPGASAQSILTADVTEQLFERVILSGLSSLNSSATTAQSSIGRYDLPYLRQLRIRLSDAEGNDSSGYGCVFVPNPSSVIEAIEEMATLAPAIPFDFSLFRDFSGWEMQVIGKRKVTMQGWFDTVPRVTTLRSSPCTMLRRRLDGKFLVFAESERQSSVPIPEKVMSVFRQYPEYFEIDHGRRLAEARASWNAGEW